MLDNWKCHQMVYLKEHSHFILKNCELDHHLGRNIANDPVDQSVIFHSRDNLDYLAPCAVMTKTMYVKFGPKCEFFRSYFNTFWLVKMYSHFGAI